MCPAHTNKQTNDKLASEYNTSFGQCKIHLNLNTIVLYKQTFQTTRHTEKTDQNSTTKITSLKKATEISLTNTLLANKYRTGRVQIPLFQDRQVGYKHTCIQNTRNCLLITHNTSSHNLYIETQ